MLPWFANARVKLCPVQDIRTGDAVVFKKDNQYICHRLHKKIKSGFKLLLKTKGDTAFSFDQPAEAEQLIGKVVVLKNNFLTIPVDNAVCRWLGILVAWLLPIAARGIYHAKNIFHMLPVTDKA